MEDYSNILPLAFVQASVWFPKLYFIDSHNWKTEEHKSSLD